MSRLPAAFRVFYAACLVVLVATYSTDLAVLEDLAQLPRTVLDDEAASASGTGWRRHSWWRTNSGSLGCGHQGWKDSFLYLEEDTSGISSATFSFDPQADGCYLIEEFHPEDVCYRRMSTQIDWAIHYGRGFVKNIIGTWRGEVRGNHWSMVSMLPFYRSHGGKVVVTRPRSTTGWTVADAFRFTHLADSCDNVSVTSLHASYPGLIQHTSVTLDDHEAKANGKALAGACGATALNGAAHVSLSRDASAEFVFEPPATGCYRLDEYHPTASETCPLEASGAAVSVEHLGEKQRPNVLALSTDGGQWNTVGHFPFGAGVLGKVISRRADAFPDKHWAVDGFRFTRVAASCSAVPSSAVLTLRIAGAQLPNANPTNPAPLAILAAFGALRLALSRALADFFEESMQGFQRDTVRLLGLRRGPNLNYNRLPESIVAEFELQGQQGRDSKFIQSLLQRATADLGMGVASHLSLGLCRAAAAAHASCFIEVLHVKEEQKYADYVEALPNKKGDFHVFGGFSVGTIFLLSICPACCLAGFVVWARRVGPPKKEEPFNEDNFDWKDLEKEYNLAKAAFEEEVLEGDSAEGDFGEACPLRSKGIPPKRSRPRTSVKRSSKAWLKGKHRQAGPENSRPVEESIEIMSTLSGSTVTPLADGISSAASESTWEPCTDVSASWEVSAQAEERLSLAFRSTPVGVFASTRGQRAATFPEKVEEDDASDDEQDEDTSVSATGSSDESASSECESEPDGNCDKHDSGSSDWGGRQR